jgi:hypothetical protein
MNQLAEHLCKLFPDAPREAVAGVASGLRDLSATGEADKLRKELDGTREELALAREENGRLLGELLRHKDGYETATRAGLDVLGERARQRRMEGYDDSHDDGHADFSLSGAAIAYAMDARIRGSAGRGFDAAPPAEWPWGISDWKPKGVRQSLIVAAALLVAEAERLDRHRPGR